MLTSTDYETAKRLSQQLAASEHGTDLLDDLADVLITLKRMPTKDRCFATRLISIAGCLTQNSISDLEMAISLGRESA